MTNIKQQIPTIKALRVLSDGNAIVVGTMPQRSPSAPVDAISDCAKKILFVGTYNVMVPPGEAVKRDVLNMSEVIFYGANCAIETISISDPHMSQPSYQASSKSAPLLPISIFLRHPDKEQLIEMRLTPRTIPATPSKSTEPTETTTDLGIYDVHSIKQAWIHSVVPKGAGSAARIGIVPGTRRTLLLTTLETAPGNHVLLNIQSHIPPSDLKDVPATPSAAATAFIESNKQSSPCDIESDPIRRTTPNRSNSLATIVMPRNIRKVIQGHLQAVAWDDCNGRLFVTMRDDCKIHMIELGAISKNN